MSIYRSWEFHGENNDGTALYSKQIECLIALDEFDLDGLEWEDGEEMFGFGDTSSSGAYERIFEALIEFAEIYPEVILTVLVHSETDSCPDGFRVQDGKVREFTGFITYRYDDDGTEVKM